MEGSNNTDLVPPIIPNNEVNSSQEAPRIIQTDVGAKDGQNKCPKCGSTEISLNPNNSLLRCHFCRHEFAPEKFDIAESDISQLQGQILGSGAQDIIANPSEVLTFKCSSCAAEVVIDTSEATQARCHWCRNTLSVNQQIPNGAIPDMVLPFGVTKDLAKLEIEKFVNKRKFFAHPKFKEEFCAENVMGVYLPYMVVDINAHAKLSGQGERLIRSYTRGSGKNQRTYYDADLYDVGREFDLVVENLTVEASADKLAHKAANKTNNVINAIMPFDTENSVRWNANYLKGYTSERRDTNVEELKSVVDVQAKDIARHNANEVLKEYDRGVCWSTEQLDIKGNQWKAAYLPVWLYSYQEVKGEKKVLHYVAVNARTKETMGSVPINMAKLLIWSVIVQIIGMLLAFFVDIDIFYLFMLSGFVFYGAFYAKYRNKGARHKHEAETKSAMSNVQRLDNLITRRKGLSNSRMVGANNLKVSNKSTGNKILDIINDGNSAPPFIKK